MNAPEKRGPEFYPPEDDDTKPQTPAGAELTETESPGAELTEADLTGADLPPAPMPERAGPSRAALSWAAAALTAGLLLAAAMCFVQFRANRIALDELRQAVEEAQTADALRKENADLRAQLRQAQEEQSRAELEAQSYLESMNRAEAEAAKYPMQLRMSGILWYIRGFMEEGDHALAASAAVYGGDYAYELTAAGDPEWSPGQMEEYRTFRVELMRLDYLSGESMEPGERVNEIARWSGLWIALREFYFDDWPSQAAVNLKDWTELQGDLLDGREDSFAGREYGRLLDTLIEQGWLTQIEGGGLYFGPAFDDLATDDILYGEG